MRLELEALAMEMPEVQGHPNKAGFRGVLTRIDEESDRAPSGARGRKVILGRAAAENALPSLIGMGVDHNARLDGHDARQKAGIITKAEIAEQELRVEGYLFARDFPELVEEMKNARLGMSYELTDARVEDMQAAVWRLTEVTFTGAAILKKEKAAYANTWVELAAETGEKMNEKQAMELMAAIQAAMAKFDELAQRLEQVSATAGEGAKRKTLPPAVTAVLAKSGIEDFSPEAVDASLSGLSVEQRIAVKSQMAKAGLIG